MRKGMEKAIKNPNRSKLQGMNPVRAIKLVKTGQWSIDKAAEEIGISVVEMMQETAKAGIRSSETYEEYRRGLNLLE